jgi:hypothetical protein
MMEILSAALAAVAANPAAAIAMEKAVEYLRMLDARMKFSSPIVYRRRLTTARHALPPEAGETCTPNLSLN